ncbi:DUF354 domain-containing protein [uncultured Methanolobus sp.]|uniref:DUF354 domain-containing protein n=1 Tax=uncultured Methanolobus sp. TaxID=218300 RepID=UPI0029C7C070|nr:DUF354 domain-containing protein [uncultured Methanolobus sp.]
MKILITMGHPAHVHFYKNFIWEMHKKGHEIKIAASNKDILLNLLDAYGFSYSLISAQKNKGFGRIKDQILHEINLYKISREFNPDVITGIGGTAASHISKITKTKSIIFTDTEHAKIANSITFPFADVICTPSSFLNKIGTKQIRYNGYHELAYLHPKYFIPNPVVLNELGLKEEDMFIVLRFISWGASHDVGHHGIENKLEFVKELEKYGKVIITSESPLEPELEQYKIKVSPEKLHDLLYYATLYIGEGGTMASEAATLGTHAIHISTTAKYCGLFSDLNKFGLMWISDDETGVIDLAKKLLEGRNLREEGKEKRETMMQDKIDVTEFMVWLIENYPDSFKIAKEKYSFTSLLSDGGPK